VTDGQSNMSQSQGPCVGQVSRPARLFSRRYRHLARTILVTLSLLSATSGCGYVVGPPYSAEIRSIHVPTFKNDTYRRGLEFQLTEAVQRQIQTRTHFQLAKEPLADTRLTGRIVRANKAVLGETHQDDARELQLSLAVELTFEDLRTRQILSQQRVPVPVDLVQQQTQSEFAVETGQSLATAEQQAIDRMARQIVDLMENPW
jgi:hypothetical protein